METLQAPKVKKNLAIKRWSSGHQTGVPCKFGQVQKTSLALGLLKTSGKFLLQCRKNLDLTGSRVPGIQVVVLPFVGIDAPVASLISLKRSLPLYLPDYGLDEISWPVPVSLLNFLSSRLGKFPVL
jgi:hypothetical protein